MWNWDWKTGLKKYFPILFSYYCCNWKWRNVSAISLKLPPADSWASIWGRWQKCFESSSASILLTDSGWHSPKDAVPKVFYSQIRKSWVISKECFQNVAPQTKHPRRMSFDFIGLPNVSNWIYECINWTAFARTLRWKNEWRRKNWLIYHGQLINCRTKTKGKWIFFIQFRIVKKLNIRMTQKSLKPITN